MGELFFQIAAVLAVAAALSFLAHKLRQPLIVAYILTGVLVGPGALALSGSHGEVFETFSQVGVSFLLFTVGLGLNWRSVKDIGGVALMTGLAQVALTGVAAFGLSHALGFDLRVSAYIAVALTFSSTIVIVKLLADKEELDTLYGRLAVGILLVQDFIAMFVLLGLAAIGTGASVQDVLIGSVLKALALIPVFWLVSAKIVPGIVAYAARSQELLFVFAIAWCFLVAGALAYFGFGIELGALIAGVTLAGTVFAQETQARVRPLRDFFLILFFVTLGTRLTFDSFVTAWPALLALTAFVLFAKPLLTLPAMRVLGYHPRTAFLTSSTMGQISEFSFIVLAAGISLGHVGEELLPLMTGVALISIAVSSYFIKHNEGIATRIHPLFRFFESGHAHRHPGEHARARPKVIMFGFHRVGAPALETLHELNKSYLVVDFDPQVVRELARLGEPVAYGDAADEIFLAEMEADRVPFLISTVPDVAVSLGLLAFLRSKKSTSTCIVSARTEDEAEQCYKAGAAYVIVPSMLGGKKFRELLEEKQTRPASWRLLGEKERDILETV